MESSVQVYWAIQHLLSWENWGLMMLSRLVSVVNVLDLASGHLVISGLS